MLGFGAFGEYAIGEIGPLPFEGRASISFGAVGAPSLLRVGEGNAGIVFGATGSMRVFVFASGNAGISFGADGSPNFVLYAATREFISRASDQIPNQPFYGTLEQTLQFDASIVAGDGFGRVSLGWGELTLINSDGYYDDIIRRYVADGRRVVISIGDERNVATTGFDGFHTVFDGTATGIHVEEDAVRVLLRDNTYKLEAPVQRSIYGGTGGLDGTEDLKGKRKPRALGYCSNLSPAFVIPNLKLFQVNDGPVQAISAVYSRGASITFDQDYPTAVDLMAATIPAGKYATCLAAGLFRVNFVLEGEVTADVEGDCGGDGFASSAAEIIQKVLGEVVGVNVPGDLDTVSFSRVEALQAAPLQYYLDTSSNVTVADLVADIMGSIGGWGGFRRDGKFELGLFRAPNTSSVPSHRYSRIDITDIRRERLPDGIDPPPYRYRVAWGRNFTTQTDLAGSVSESRVAFLSEGYRLAEASDAIVQSDHPLAQDPSPVESYFRDEADAQAEAERLLDLYGRATRSLYRIVLKSRPFIHYIGELMWVDYPRWDLQGGRMLRIVSVSEKTESNEVEVIGFG
ncbi:MAG: hypothetical protein WC026_16975 [Hyphomicrobium sp.]|uniref:hypothetical protein n=1 Tax=Hyphomicrobium sp. TaxID=82 RepID=UPI00356818CB